MCRLYQFRSSTPRKVECELIRSQNSLLSQASRDERGQSNPHGWGLGIYEKKSARVVKQAEPAASSESFRWEAARVHTHNAVGHVRRATVGRPHIDNTHPFKFRDWIFAHNGNLGAFENLRPRLLSDMSPAFREAIRGDTDSEHVFQWLLSGTDGMAPSDFLPAMGRMISKLAAWSHQEDAGAEVALNVVLTNGRYTAGLRHGRSLWFAKRHEVHRCEICGDIHVSADESTEDYKAVVVASERITRTEQWTTFPDSTLFEIDETQKLRMMPL